MALHLGLLLGQLPAAGGAGRDATPRPMEVGRSIGPRCVLLILLYTVAALASLLVSRQPTSIAGIWFANAVAVAFFVMAPRRDWPALAAAVAVSVPLANGLWGDDPLAALSFLPPNLIEIVLAAWLLQRFDVRAGSLSSITGITKLLLLGGVAPQVVGASGGAMLVTWHTDVSFAVVWASWFASSTIGAVSLLPLALWIGERGIRSWAASLRDARLMVLAPLVVAVTVFSVVATPYPFVFVPLPLLLAAIVAPVPVVATLTAASSALIAGAMAMGWFAPQAINGHFEQVAVYFAIAAVLLPANLLSAVVAELRHSRQHLIDQTHALQRAHDGLELFVRFASHDLREPLNGIAGLAELLEQETKTTLHGEPRRYVALLADSARHMRRLLDDMLVFTRTGQQATDAAATAVCLDKVFAELLQSNAKRLAAAGAKVEVGQLGWVVGHPMMLPLVFQNLLSNAVKFVAPGRTPHVRVFAHRHGGELIVGVSDNGIGIDPRHLGKLFEPFQRLQTRTAYEGTGLGLALAKKVVDAHRGRIEVESTPGNGTTFRVHLPIADDSTPGRPSERGGGLTPLTPLR